MPDKEMFVLKIVWKKSIASLHRLTQAIQRANLRRTGGPYLSIWSIFFIAEMIVALQILIWIWSEWT